MRDPCIIRHSLCYYRHSGLVIYMSKLPVPSVSMPCDYRILQSPPLNDKFYLSFGRPSDGLNEGKARNETLGTHVQKHNELRQGAALTVRAFVFVSLRFVALRSCCCGSLGKCRPFGAQKMRGNNKPRACALGYAGVSPRWGSFAITPKSM